MSGDVGGGFSMTETDPWATWDAALDAGRFSDKPDGLPDTRMVNLVQQLRGRGIVTLQSCQGHSGTDDGHLWIDANTVHAGSVEHLFSHPFTLVSRVFWPVDRWELWWLPEDQETCIQALHGLSRARSLQSAVSALPAHWESMAGPPSSVYETCARDLRSALGVDRVLRRDRSDSEGGRDDGRPRRPDGTSQDAARWTPSIHGGVDA